MGWDQMSARQKSAARGLTDDLSAVGVCVSVVEVAEHFDDAAAWRRGEVTLGALCRRAGWDLPEGAAPEPGKVLADAIAAALAGTDLPALGTVERIAHLADQMRALKDAWAGRRDALQAGLLASDRRKTSDPAVDTSRETLVRAAKPALSRRLVLEYLGAEDLLTTAKDALGPNGYFDHDTYRLTLKRAGDGLRLEFDAFYRDGEDDEDDRYDDSPARRFEEKRRDGARSVDEHNYLAGALLVLGKAGLDVTSDGPCDTLINDLRDGHPATITKKPTGNKPRT
ncbi:hypothetical protein [Streptomyces noursei]|uniref:Uncharacterized protein n=1 Tax=Streptomyces noursei TaxID=1971 RepID=A0A2N8PR93_STRNR|nr:hypothetical protein [Streptomyces noursei]PNE43507.1 hypothetical protein AOB60_00945 [Streptomyces noursei]